MKKTLLVTLFALFSINVFAQHSDTKTAQTILNGVSEKYKSFSSVKAEFSLKSENGANQATENQTGTLYVKGNKFKLELNNQEITCDNVTIWTYLKDANEVQINNYEPDENSISPTQIFTIYEKNFLYGFIEEKTVGGKVFQVIDLTPKDKTKSYFKIRLMINKTDKMVSQAKVFDKNGNKYTYEIQKFSPNIPLADDFFTFDMKKHPGVEAVNLK